MRDIERQETAKRAAAIENKLKTESRDRNWASAAEDRVQNAVKTAVDNGAQFKASTLKCLTSICELVLAADSPDKLQRAMYQIYGITGMAGFSAGQPQKAADGSSSLTVRFFREGYPMPGREQ
jgi:hypothetical protein